jgi:hypothetical protein
MNRRIFVTGCLTAAAGSVGAAASTAPSPTRWSRLRRKLMRSHIAVLLGVGAVIGVGAWRHRRDTAPAQHVPPWERK